MGVGVGGVVGRNKWCMRRTRLIGPRRASFRRRAPMRRPRRFAGNFLTLEYVVNEYSCDATRITLADAGDGLDDANFVRTVVNAQILKLTKEIDWSAAAQLRTVGEGRRLTDGLVSSGEVTFFHVSCR